MSEEPSAGRRRQLPVFHCPYCGEEDLVPEGESVEGFQVHLGGHLGVDAALGRKLRGHKITKEETADYCERLLRGYLARREPGERFAAYVSRADEAWLR